MDWEKISTATAIAVVVVAAFFVGRNTAPTNETQKKRITIADIEREKEDPSVSAASALSAPARIKWGEEIFVENCEACHQSDAIGQPGIAPSLTNPELLSLASDTFFESTIIEGRDDTGMPPFDFLDVREVQAIVAYLRSHEVHPNRSAQIDAQPDAHGDPRLGKLWYDNICSTCHGAGGDGYLAGGTGTAIGLSGFLNTVSDGFIRETIKHGRSNTRMLAFQGPAALANLSDEEIDDTIVYLRQLAENHQKGSDQ